MSSQMFEVESNVLTNYGRIVLWFLSSITSLCQIKQFKQVKSIDYTYIEESVIRVQDPRNKKITCIFP